MPSFAKPESIFHNLDDLALLGFIIIFCRKFFDETFLCLKKGCLIAELIL